ncbi:MAG: hypothetical protein ABI160_09830 [Mycobacteriaceae bacterium]
MAPEDARTMLTDLQEETVRLQDPAGWQFVGGDPAADAASADALAAQLDGVPALRRLAPALGEAAGRSAGEVLSTIGEYEQATRAALERTRSGRAPEQPQSVQLAPTADPTDPADPSAPAEAPARTGRAPGTGPATGMGAAQPPRPSLGASAVVAAVVLVVVVVVVGVVLLVL